MRKSQTPLSADSVRFLGAHLLHGIPSDLPEEAVDYWKAHKEELHQLECEMLMRPVSAVAKPAAKAPKPAAPRMFGSFKKVELTALPEFRPTDVIRVTPVNDRKTATTVIGYVDSALQTLMEKIGVEPARKAEVVTVRKMLVQVTFAQMVASCSRKPKPMSLGQALAMVARQGRGQEGDLLVNGWANFILLERGRQVLSCYFDPDCQDWDFHLFSVAYTSQWDAGHQFISC